MFFILDIISNFLRYFDNKSLNSLFFFKDFLFWKNFKKRPTDNEVYNRPLEFKILMKNLLDLKLKYML